MEQGEVRAYAAGIIDAELFSRYLFNRVSGTDGETFYLEMKELNKRGMHENGMDREETD